MHRRLLDPYNEIEASRPPQMSETEFVSQLISKCKRFGRTHDCVVWMVVHPTKLNSQGETKEPMTGMYDMAGSAYWRNKFVANPFAASPARSNSRSSALTGASSISMAAILAQARNDRAPCAEQRRGEASI